MARKLKEDREYQDRVDAILRARGEMRLTYAAERRRERTEESRRVRPVDGDFMAQAFCSYELDCLVWKEIEDIARCAGITDRQNQVLLLRYHIGSTIREAANALDISEKTVKRDTDAAMKRIKNYCDNSPYALLWEVLREIFGSRILHLAGRDKK